jgi:hypothetical protein
MKAIVLCFEDADQGATANDIALRAKVCFCGSDMPNGAIIDMGPEGNGLALNIAINNLANYPNVIEDALIARAAQLGLPAVARTDCLFPTYQRGAN